MEHLGNLVSVGRRWSLEEGEPTRGAGESQELVVTTVHDPPYMVISRHRDGSFNFSGYLFDLWKTMARELDVRFRMMPLLNADYGTPYENGTWSGMVGKLAYGRADLAVAPIDFRSDRASVVDYIDAYPVHAITNKFYVPREMVQIPKVTASLFATLLMPLHVNVWWSLLAFLLVLSIVLWLTQRFSYERAQNRETSKDMTWSS